MAAPKGPPRRSGSSKRTKVSKPWEPTALQLEWYRKWVEESKGPSQIAAEHHIRISRQNVFSAIYKVEEYFRGLTKDEILAFRFRMTCQYEMVQQIAMKAFVESAGEVVTTTETQGSESSSSTTKTEYSQGQTSYLSIYMAAMKGIRELKGIDSPAKSEVTHRHAEEIEGLPLPQGHKRRSDALREAAAAMLAIADRADANAKA